MCENALVYNPERTYLPETNRFSRGTVLGYDALTSETADNLAQISPNFRADETTENPLRVWF